MWEAALKHMDTVCWRRAVCDIVPVSVLEKKKGKKGFSHPGPNPGHLITSQKIRVLQWKEISGSKLIPRRVESQSFKARCGQGDVTDVTEGHQGKKNTLKTLKGSAVSRANQAWLTAEGFLKVFSPVFVQLKRCFITMSLHCICERLKITLMN